MYEGQYLPERDYYYGCLRLFSRISQGNAVLAVEGSKNVKIEGSAFLISWFPKKAQFLSYLILHRFIYFNNLFFTISKEVIYKDLFKSGLKTCHNLRIWSRQKLLLETKSICYRWSKESKYSQKERNWKSKKEYKNP